MNDTTKGAAPNAAGPAQAGGKAARLAKMGNTIVAAAAHAITSMRDAVTQAAQSSGRMAIVAEWFRANVVGWPELNKADKAAFFEAAIDYRQTAVPGVYYQREGLDTYSKLPAKPAKGVEYVLIDSDYASGMTGQVFGSLRKDQPNLHGLVKARRDADKKFASNLLGDIQAKDRQLHPKDRGPKGTVKTMHETFTETFKAWEKKTVTAKTSRGDDTAPDVAKLKEAIKAFWAVLNGK